MTKFPKLAAMAISWCSVHKPRAREALKQLEGYKINEKYVSEANKIVKPHLISDVAQRGVVELLALARQSGVPLKIDDKKASEIDFSSQDYYDKEN